MAIVTNWVPRNGVGGMFKINRESHNMRFLYLSPHPHPII
jgi:hypothetical protein